MSNNIYDILGKLKGLTPKENPVSTASGPIYESVAPRGDIIGGIKALNEKYYKAQNQPQPQQQQSDDVRYQSDNPLVKGFLQRAYQEFPNSANDNEAIVALMAKDKQEEDQIDAQANDWMQQAKSKIDTQQDKMNDMAQVIIDQEKRFQDFNKEVAATKDLSVADKAKAAGEFAKVNKTSKDKTDAAAKGKQIIDKTKADSKDKNKDKEEYVKLKDEPEQDTKAQDEVPATAEPVADKSADKDLLDVPDEKPAADINYKEIPKNVIDFKKADTATQKAASAFGDEDEPVQGVLPLKFAAESKTIKEEVPAQAELAFDEIPRLRQQLRQDVRNFILTPDATVLTLQYPGGRNVQYPRAYILRLAEILNTMDPAEKQNFFDNVLPSADKFTAFIEKLKTQGNTYYFYKVTTPEQIIDAKKLELGQTKNGSWYSPNFPNPQAERLFGPGRKWTAPSKQQTQESKNFLGNDNMSNNIYNILGRFNNLWKTESTETVVDLGEPVYQVYENVEANGDINEAVKSLESKFETYKNEVSEGKKLKDKKQFDDTAETGDYYLTDKGNKVIKTKTGIKHEKVHAADKDDDQMDEALPPGVTPPPKYVPSGNPLPNTKQVGTKYSPQGTPVPVMAPKKPGELEEGAKPDFLDVDKDGDKKEPFKKAVKDKEKVEEATEFGDTIKNSEGKMTKAKVAVKEGKDAIRNHPIYTTKEAWDHYSQELAEQEAMDQEVMEAPVIDAQQELAEIAGLAGLTYESKCSSCGCADCKCGTLDESMSRKDYRAMANDIADMDNRDDAKRLAHKYAVIAKKDNPRFKEDMFFAACKLDVAECGMSAPATIIVGEEAMDEGNEFTKARLDAIAQGKDTFSVGGKTYNVSGDTSDEKQQVESIEESTLVTEDVNVNITANGEEDVVKLIQKLAGMPMIAIQAPQQAEVEEPCGACGSSPCGCEEVVDEQRDIEWDNTPNELTAPISAAIPSGTDLNRSKLQDPATANKAANPLGQSQVEESLWKAYEEIINDVKA